MAKGGPAAGRAEQRRLAHLAGPLCMGQIAAAAALGYLDFAMRRATGAPGTRALVAFAARMAARD
ncbi:MAG: glutathione S-transferase, partial [Gemmobacter sp.]|nr:glutathione S-transferase [Gemmobacter sp.]